MVVTMLDEVAWLLNLRGSDIDYNPVFFAYVIVTDDKAVLFVNPAQVDDSVRHSLGDFVQILSYDAFFPYLKGLAAEVQFTKEAVSLVEKQGNISNHTCPKGVLLSDKSSLAVAEAIGRVR